MSYERKDNFENKITRPTKLIADFKFTMKIDDNYRKSSVDVLESSIHRRLVENFVITRSKVSEEVDIHLSESHDSFNFNVQLSGQNESFFFFDVRISLSINIRYDHGSAFSKLDTTELAKAASSCLFISIKPIHNVTFN